MRHSGICLLSSLNNEAEWAIQNGLPDNLDFFRFCGEMERSNMANGSVWITKIRNEINYQHKHESWMPLTKKSPSNSFSNCRLDVSKIKEPIKSFFCICCYISELNFQVAARISAKSKTGRTFGQRWMRLLSLIDFAR